MLRNIETINPSDCDITSEPSANLQVSNTYSTNKKSICSNCGGAGYIWIGVSCVWCGGTGTS